MNINDRIRTIIQTHRLTAAQFADQMGVQRSNVSHVLSGRNKPSFEFLEKLFLAFPKVSAHWLVTGNHLTNQQTNLHLPFESETELIQTDSIVEEEFLSDQIKTVEEIVSKQPEVTIVNKAIVKTIVFYADFTFDVYVPNEQ